MTWLLRVVYLVITKDKDCCETQFSGLDKKNSEWSVRARANSYHADKSQLRHDLGGEGAAKDYKSGDQPTPVRKFEGRGWAKMDAVTQATTFTGTTIKK